ncbi:hypothetical protein ACOMHN_033946 [Nucella lapillus]
MVNDTGLPFQHGRECREKGRQSSQHPADPFYRGGECREKGRKSSQHPADPSYRGGECREKGPILTAPGRSFLQGWGMQGEGTNPHSARPILPTGVGNAGRRDQSSQRLADPSYRGGECREKGRQSSQRLADPSYRGGECRTSILTAPGRSFLQGWGMQGEGTSILTAPGRSFLQGWGMQDFNPHSTWPILPTGVGNVGHQSSQHPADPSYRGGECRTSILTAPGRSFLQGWGMQDVNPHSTRPILPTGVGNAGRQSSQHLADPTYRGGASCAHCQSQEASCLSTLTNHSDKRNKIKGTHV